MNLNNRRCSRVYCLCFFAFMLSGGAAARPTEAELDAKRAAFREVYPAVELGEWQPVVEKQQLLEDYVLWPDLRAAWLRANLETADEGEIRDFLAQYGKLKPARELRYRFALQLAEETRWPEFLALYERHYKNLGVARLDCLAVHAGILGGERNNVVKLARDLWLTGQSQVDECNPVFDYLRGAGLLDDGLLEARFQLAVSAKQFSLARYLSRSMDPAYLDDANRWIEARNHAESFLQADADCSDSDVHREQLLFAIERVAYSDAKLASDYWQDVQVGHRFSPGEMAHILRHIALSAAQQHQPDAFQYLSNLPDGAVDERIRAWRARAALLKHAWQDVIDVVEAMPREQQREEEWQYWLAVALAQSGRESEARPMLRDLAASRSYFGFLAADEVGADYAFAHVELSADEAVIRDLSENPSLIRARELYYVGLESRGRSEWNEAMDTLDPDQVVEAAVLAHRWNWHSQAIATVADAGQYDDLEIRYPLPYAEKFREYSAAANIRGSWAYGVARSESLFMSDIRSHAGAVGLMQLMPATGRRTAAEIELPYLGVKTLTDPDSNIRLGTTYLGKMLQRFDDNLVLATAAYNAGPFKVEEWLPESDSLEARIWIETIPYRETRRFVRRVLFSDAIFNWRLTGETRRLSAAFNAIGPAADPEKVSSVGKNIIPGG